MTFTHKNITAYGLYMEARQESYTMQVLFTAPGVRPGARDITPATIIKRVISAENPKRKWFNKEIALPSVLFDATQGKIKEATSILESADQTRPLIEAISRELDNAQKSDWKWQGDPIILEVTTADMLDIERSITPPALMRRVTNARKDAGYPDSILVGSDDTELEEF